MQHMKSIWLATVLLVGAALTSCGTANAPEPTQDVNALYTSAAGTTVAQLTDQQTQTAQAIPPTSVASPTALDTFTPPPTFPVTPLGTPLIINTPGGAVLPTTSTRGGTPGSTTVGCNDATFISETISDGTQFTAGENFSKGWTFKNTGTCTWINSFSFAFMSGDQMGGKDRVISRSVDFVLPGNSRTFIVELEAPRAAGHYKGYWQMKDPQGIAFGSRVWVDIVVKK
jgi:hypothetical protein